MDATSLARIQTLHPQIRSEVKDLYDAINSALPSGHMLRITQAFRSIKEQNALFAKRPKVTNARGYQSMHNYGLAFDICILKDLNRDGKYEMATWDIDSDAWKIATRVFVARGYSNGFVKNGRRWDFPHFQKNFGLSWQECKKRLLLVGELSNSYIPL